MLFLMPLQAAPRPYPAAIVMLSLAVGCTPPDPGHSSPPDSGDSEVVDDSNPPEPDDYFLDIAFTQSTLIPSVVTVTWRTPEPATCTVAFGADGDLSLSTLENGEPSTDHAVPLVGLRPGSTGTLQISTETGAGLRTSAAQTFTTGLLPHEVPTVDVAVHDAARAFDGFTLVPLLNDDPSGRWIAAIDATGTVVWAYKAEFQPHRARLAPDGGGVMFIDRAGTFESDCDGTVRSIAWDGTERWRWSDEAAQFDFAILGPDRFAALAYDSTIVNEGRPDEREYFGDAIIEFDSAGNSQVVWSIFDDIDPVQIPGTVTAPVGNTNMVDWSHGNYLTWDPETESYLVVLRHLDAIVSVDGTTGDMLWSLSNDWGTYNSQGGDPVLSWPHSVERTGAQLAVFNQTHDHDGDACSHGRIVTLDASVGTADSAWEYQNAECSKVLFLGSTHPLPSGNLLVDFSQAGIMDEVTLDGELVQRFDAGLGWTFGFAQPVEQLAPLAP